MAATNLSLNGMLEARVVSGVVSEIAAQSGGILSWFNMQPGSPGFEGQAAGLTDSGMSFPGKGSACKTSAHPTIASWDIYNHTRMVGAMRNPGASFADEDPNPTGRKDFRMFRLATQVKLGYEEIFQLRRIGGPLGEIDREGRDYVMRQMGTLAEKAINFRTMLVAAMLRGTYYQYVRGQDVYMALDTAPSAPYNTVDLDHPAGNRGNLTMDSTSGQIINVLWTTANAATSTPITDCLKVNAALLRLCGRKLSHVLISSTDFLAVLASAEVKGFAGTANTPFLSWSRVGGKGPDGIDYNGTIATLTGLPFVQFHVIDDVFQINGPDGTTTTVSIIPAGRAAFLPEPSPRDFTFWEGSEVVIEGPGQPEKQVTGMHAWGTTVDNAAAKVLRCVDRGIAVPLIPKSYCWATIA